MIYIRNRQKRKHYQWIAAILISIVLISLQLYIDKGPLLFATQSETAVIMIAHDEKQATLSVQNTNMGVAFVELRLGEVSLAKNPLENQTTQFIVDQNGTYTWIAYDTALTELSSGTLEVNVFDSLIFERQENTLHIIGRDQASYIKIDQLDQQEILSIVPLEGHLYETVIPYKDGMQVSATSLNADQQPLHDPISYKGEDIQTQVEEASVVKEIRTLNELAAMQADPTGSYRLMNDLDVENFKTMSFTFAGQLDGNGYRILNVKEPLFQSLDHALITNLHLRMQSEGRETMAGLAYEGTGTNINRSSVMGESKSKNQSAGFLLDGADNEYEYVYAGIHMNAEEAAGIQLHGTGAVKNSYVNGVIEGTSGSGFGASLSIMNSYMSGSVLSEHGLIFNEDGISLSGCFYDFSATGLEDYRATSYDHETMVKGGLPEITGIFEEKAGSYPSFPQNIIDTFTPAVQEEIELSTLMLDIQDDESYQNIREEVSLPQKSSQDNSILWSSEQLPVSQEKIALSQVKNADEQTEGIVTAQLAQGKRYFALKNAVVLSEQTVQVGSAIKALQTYLFFNAQHDAYYQVIKAQDTVPEVPNSHEMALTNGWKRQSGIGVMHWGELSWNTTYHVYVWHKGETAIQELGSATTKKGLIGGNIHFDQEPIEGEQIKATLEEALDAYGYWVWESCADLGKNEWKELYREETRNDHTTSTFLVPAHEEGSYVRASFYTAQDSMYEDEASAISSLFIRTDIKNVLSIKLEGKPQIAETMRGVIYDKQGQKTTAYDSDIDVYWYRIEADAEPSVDDQFFYIGNEYTIKKEDIGKKLYNKAVAKSDHKLLYSTSSQQSDIVKTIQLAKPVLAPEIVKEKISDVFITVKMPDQVAKGTYQFGFYKKSDGEKNIQVFDTLAQDHDEVVIRGIKDDGTPLLEANTEYMIKVRAKGLDGFLDSEWGNATSEAVTSFPKISGTVSINGEAKLNETLTAIVSGGYEDQKGTWKWYRVDQEGEKLSETPISTSDTYMLQKEDIDHYVMAEYTGDSSGEHPYCGSIQMISDQVERLRREKPNVTVERIVAGENGHDQDSRLSLYLPTNDASLQGGDHYIIGISTDPNGAPQEYKENGITQEYDPIAYSGKQIVLKELNRNQKYYIFLRYQRNETHEKSDWADLYASGKSEETLFKGTIAFIYEQDTLGRGEVLKASLNQDATTTEGTWKWVKYSAGGSNATPIESYTGDDTYTTYIVVSDDESAKTQYVAEFTPVSGYQGTVTSEKSKPVTIAQKPKYPTPTTLMQSSESDDSSIHFKVDASEGLYAFRYRIKGDSEWIEGTQKAFFNTEITLNDLMRDTTYEVQAMRTKDDAYEDSDYSTAIEISTKKTEIRGYISLQGEAITGNRLEAIYHSADYIPSASDEGGVISWFDENDRLVGTGNSYEIKTSDIGKQFYASYSPLSSSSFSGSVRTEYSEVVRKKTAVNPTATLISYETVDGTLRFQAKTDANTYVQLRKASSSYPTPPTDNELKNWIKIESTDPFPIALSYQPDSGKSELVIGNTEYILYAYRPESSITLSSAVMASNSMKTPLDTQSGNVTYTNTTTNAQLVPGSSLQATLKNHNNKMGSWKWYISATDYKTSNPTSWKQITSGYYPAVNEDNSTLTITEDMWGKYIKAEFVADEYQGYTGTRSSGKYANYVKKVYNEQLTITSSNPDSGSTNRAYMNNTITGTIKNYAETGAINQTRTTVKFKIGTQEISGNQLTYKDNTFSYTMPNTDAWNGQEVTAEISKPKDLNLYVTQAMGTVSSQNLNSKTDTKTSLTYMSGIPINTTSDFDAFLSKSGVYGSDSAKYILTGNIRYTTSKTRGGSFSGILDGDYHTLVGLVRPIFNQINGTSSKPVQIKNMIISDVNIKTSGKISIITTSGYWLNASNLLYVNANVSSNHDTSFMFGYVENGNIDQSGAAGGSIYNSAGGTSTGAIVGHLRSSGSVTNCFSDNVTVEAGSTGTRLGSLIGSTNGPIVIKNNYAVGEVKGIATDYKYVGGINGENQSSSTSQNNFYDKTISSDSRLEGTYKGTGKTTTEMVGTGLSANLGTSGIWTYTNGYYPRLSWINKEALNASPGAVHISNMYAATRGAFIPQTSATSTNDLYSGILRGPVSVPEELQKLGFTYQSMTPSVIAVSSGGTIVPIGNTGSVGKIRVTFKDESTGAQPYRDFEFTIQAKNNAFSSVSITGSPRVSETLRASASGASTFTWYRRSAGSTSKTQIAIGTTYQIKPQDTGYEISVVASGGSYAAMQSAWTSAVTMPSPNAPTVTVKDDQSVLITGNGGTSTDYEYAYATSIDGDKVVYSSKGASITLTGLRANTQYYFFSRIAGGSGYSASEWSKSSAGKTKQMPLSGDIDVGVGRNVDDTFTFKMPDTNAQQGVWSLIRNNADGTKTTLKQNISDYTMTYTLVQADAGCTLTATFSASGDYTGSKTYTSETILKKRQDAPSKVTLVSQSDNSIKVHLHTEGTYEMKYMDVVSGKETILPNTYAGSNDAVITGLSRNKEYTIAIRKIATTTQEASAWIIGDAMKTEKTSLTDFMTVSKEHMVNEVVRFEAPATNDQIGTWKVERIKAGMKATLATYDIDITGRVLTYQIVPADSGSIIKATFMGSGDYKGELSVNSKEIVDATPATPDMKELQLSNVKEYSIDAMMKSGHDTYEFGYQEEGSDTIQIFEGTATANTLLSIRPLKRNTTYRIYVRVAKQIGYTVSDWSIASDPFTTKKTTLSGNINFVKGQLKVGETVEMAYQSGTYPYEGDDTKEKWTWYLDHEQIENEQTSSLTIPKIAGSPKLKVTYCANEQSDFIGCVTRILGTVEKEKFGIPSAPQVEALMEDGNFGSRLKMTSNDTTDVFYYLQKADQTNLPTLVKATDAISNTAQADQWFPAQASMEVVLDAYSDYSLYAARLDDGNKLASEFVSVRCPRTVKEHITSERARIEEVDDLPWKAEVAKTLRVQMDETAIQGAWKFFVAEDKNSTNWKELSQSQVKAVIKQEGSYNTLQVQMPKEYTGYYLKSTFIGKGKYDGQTSYLSTRILLGKPISGTIIVDQRSKQIYDDMQVRYDGEDHKSGTWTWCRESDKVTTPTQGVCAYGFEEVKPQSGISGITSTYKTSYEDLNKRIYAIYQADAASEYSGSVSSEISGILEKAIQGNVPIISNSYANGTTVYFDTLQESTLPQIEVPRVQVGYVEKAVKEALDDQTQLPEIITWQTTKELGSKRFLGLKKETAYLIYARFMESKDYAQSKLSDAYEVQTQKGSFDQSKLTIQYEEKDRYMDVGSKVIFTFQGKGYDQGSFTLYRSDDLTTPIISNAGEKDDAADTMSYTYTLKTEDIGTHIIVEYKANNDALYYSGYIRNATRAYVTKPKNSLVPPAAHIRQDLDTNLYVQVSDQYDYILQEDAITPSYDDVRWQSYPADENNEYEFVNLKRDTTYYLYTRYRETQAQRASEATLTSAKTLSYIDAGTMSLENQDLQNNVLLPAYGESNAIPLPHSLDTSKRMQIKEIQLYRNIDEFGKDETSATVIDEALPRSEFVNTDGSAHPNVYERGSTWANTHYAGAVAFYDKQGTLLDIADAKHGVTISNGTALRLQLYRANAVSEGGTYTLNIILEDESGHTAHLHAKVTMMTQMKAVADMKTFMYLSQSYDQIYGSGTTYMNTNAMPIEISVDQKAMAQTALPALYGELQQKDVAHIKKDNVYLHMGIDETFGWNSQGIWFDTNQTVSQYQRLMQLGAWGKGTYYLQGFTSPYTKWPWPDTIEELDESQIDPNNPQYTTSEMMIRNAYIFEYRCTIATEDNKQGEVNP